MVKKNRKIRLIALLVMTAVMILAFPASVGAEPQTEPAGDAGNRFDSVVGTLGKTISLSFRMILADAENPTATFTCLDSTKTVAAVPVEPAQSFTEGEKTFVYYDAVCDGISPQNVTTEMSVTVRDGETVLLTKKYSFKEYLDTLLENDPGNEKLAVLADAVFYYGNEFNRYLENEVDELAKDPATGKIAVPGFDLKTMIDFDAVSPDLTNRGFEKGASVAEESVGGNKVLRAVSSQSYSVVSFRKLLDGATRGKNYRLTFRYKVEKVIGDAESASFGVCYAAEANYAGTAIKTVTTKQIGEWQTGCVDFIYNSANTPSSVNGLSFVLNGLGTDPTGNEKYGILFDDVALLEMKHPVPTAAAATPVNVGDAVIKSANVRFDSQNKILVKYECSVPVVTKINGTTVTPVSEGGTVYSITTDGIAPADFDSKFSFTVGYSSLSYSINDYVCAKRNTDAISRLAKALYAYGVAAEKYAAE